MAKRVLHFGAASRRYDFAGDGQQKKFSTTFADLVTGTSRLPYSDGGNDDYGTGRSYSEVGQIKLSYMLIAPNDDREEIDDARDALLRMADWGVQYLFIQPSEPTDPKRFIPARINNIGMPEELEAHTDLWQPVQISWQASYPFWRSKPGQWFLGDGHDLDDVGLNIMSFDDVTVDASSTLTLTNNGSAPALMRVMFKATVSGGAVLNPGLRLIDPDTLLTLSEWRWLGLIEPDEQLLVDGNRKKVVWMNVGGDTDGYPQYQVSVGEMFMRLEPGVNTIQVLGTFEDDALLNIEFFDTWR